MYLYLEQAGVQVYFVICEGERFAYKIRLFLLLLLSYILDYLFPDTCFVTFHCVELNGTLKRICRCLQKTMQCQSCKNRRT